MEEREYSPSGFNHLLRDIVEEVPAAEGEGRLQEGQSDLTHRWRPLHGEGHLGGQGLVVPWKVSRTFECFFLPHRGRRGGG